MTSCSKPVKAVRTNSDRGDRAHGQDGRLHSIGSRGWLISTTSPKTTPSFDLNRTVVQQAEHYGLDFALSMIKMRGFGGPSGYWDENLESFTLMAGIAAVTRRIQLFASVRRADCAARLRRPHGGDD